MGKPCIFPSHNFSITIKLLSFHLFDNASMICLLQTVILDCQAIAMFILIRVVYVN